MLQCGMKIKRDKKPLVTERVKSRGLKRSRRKSAPVDPRPLQKLQHCIQSQRSSARGVDDNWGRKMSNLGGEGRGWGEGLLVEATQATHSYVIYNRDRLPSASQPGLPRT